MTVTLVDTRYYGKILRMARKSMHISAINAAQMLKLSRWEYAKCEHGKAIIPEPQLQKLFAYAFMAMQTRAYITQKQ